MWSLGLIWLDASDEMDGGRVEFIHEIIDFFWEFAKNGLSSLVLHGIGEEPANNLHNLLIDLVLILNFEGSDVVIDWCLSMQDGEFGLVDLVEDKGGMVDLPEALDDVCISELRKGHIVCNREEGQFAADHSDDFIISGRQDT